MKLNEITGKEKAKDVRDLMASIVSGKFTKDGSHLNVIGNFLCATRNLTSLEGCPKEVTGYFYCYENKLTSLEGCPSKVGDNFLCYENALTSLEGCPQELGRVVSVIDNKLTSLKNIHKHIKKMNGKFYANGNPITSHVLGLLKIPGCEQVVLNNKKVEKIINKYLPLGDLIDCQEELIEAGFPEYAQL